MARPLYPDRPRPIPTPRRPTGRAGCAPPRSTRHDAEFRGGHLPDAIHIELGALEAAVHRLSTGPTVVMCGHGERAAGAVSLLEHIGHHDLALLADLCRSL